MKSIAAFINQDLFHWWKIFCNIKIVIEQLKIFQTLLDDPTIDNHVYKYFSVYFYLYRTQIVEW